MVFLEVPCESPFRLDRIVRRVAQIGIVALTHPSLAPAVLRPASLYMMHEHINYFTEHSLVTLMRSCGLGETVSGSYSSDGRSGKGDMVWCLGTAG